MEWILRGCQFEVQRLHCLFVFVKAKSDDSAKENMHVLQEYMLACR